LEEVIATSKEKNKEQPYFRGMFLYLAEELPKILIALNYQVVMTILLFGK